MPLPGGIEEVCCPDGYGRRPLRQTYRAASSTCADQRRVFTNGSCRLMPIKTKEEGRTEATLDDAAHALFPRVHETALDSVI